MIKTCSKWYQTDLKVQELALLVVQLSSPIYIQGFFFFFLIIVCQYLLADVFSKAEHFQFLQPSKERKEIQVK